MVFYTLILILRITCLAAPGASPFLSLESWHSIFQHHSPGAAKDRRYFRFPWFYQTSGYFKSGSSNPCSNPLRQTLLDLAGSSPTYCCYFSTVRSRWLRKKMLVYINIHVRVLDSGSLPRRNDTLSTVPPSSWDSLHYQLQNQELRCRDTVWQRKIFTLNGGKPRSSSRSACSSSGSHSSPASWMKEPLQLPFLHRIHSSSEPTQKH